jgi:hypothetical protein
MWNYICCPSCDYTWSFNLKGSLVPPPPEPELDPWNLKGLFEHLDKFTAFILGIPAAAAHPNVIKQLDFIKSSREQLQLAQTEHQVHLETRLEEVNRLQKSVQQQEQALLKEKEDLEKPGPPLDAATLTQALLKDLGFFGEEKTPKKDGAPAPPPGKAQVDILDHPLVRKAIKKISRPS